MSRTRCSKQFSSEPVTRRTVTLSALSLKPTSSFRQVDIEPWALGLPIDNIIGEHLDLHHHKACYIVNTASESLSRTSSSVCSTIATSSTTERRRHRHA
ncbi:DUF6735 family protein [Halosimplex sp. J119]